MITVIAWFVVIFTFLQFLVALANLLFAERMRMQVSPGDGKVSVLIPARNEEKNIGTIIEDILQQVYQNFELIVCDDQSDDSTAEIVDKYALKDSRIKLIRSSELPEGWLGKNHACHTLGGAASGEHYLFLDADVRINGDIIPQAIMHSRKHGISLISIFPGQIMKSAGEKISVPVMNYILLSLLPLILVRRSSRPALAAANGQFMFFEASAYTEHQPHMTFRAHKVEDIAIARHFKAIGLTVSCQTGDDRLSCRMYQGFKDAVNGFSKNVIDFFGGSFFFAILFWALTTIGMIFVITGLPAAIIIFFFLIYFLTRIFISLRSRQNIFENLIYMIPQQISMGVFIFKAIMRTSMKKHEWKGRNI